LAGLGGQLGVLAETAELDAASLGCGELLLCLSRAERFAEGIWGDYWKEGVIPAILLRLEQLGVAWPPVSELLTKDEIRNGTIAERDWGWKVEFKPPKPKSQAKKKSRRDRFLWTESDLGFDPRPDKEEKAQDGAVKKRKKGKGKLTPKMATRKNQQSKVIPISKGPAGSGQVNVEIGHGGSVAQAAAATSHPGSLVTSFGVRRASVRNRGQMGDERLVTNCIIASGIHD
jgi:hypothetical protein